MGSFVENKDPTFTVQKLSLMFEPLQYFLHS